MSSPLVGMAPRCPLLICRNGAVERRGVEATSCSLDLRDFRLRTRFLYSCKNHKRWVESNLYKASISADLWEREHIFPEFTELLLTGLCFQPSQASSLPPIFCLSECCCLRAEFWSFSCKKFVCHPRQSDIDCCGQSRKRMFSAWHSVLML